VSIRSVTIVGLGLIGGSVARAARRKNRRTIRAVDPADLHGVAERVDGRLGELVGDEDDGPSGCCHSGFSSVSIRARPV
jgi:prephenate dehydrogenase